MRSEYAEFDGATGRFAALIDAMRKRVLDESALERMAGVLATGRHDPRHGFTTAYFHRPEELRSELVEAGFGEVAVVGVEGPGWLLMAGEADADREPPDPGLLAALFIVLKLEREPTVIGTSAHILGFGYRG